MADHLVVPLRVTVWNEFVHERTDERIRATYPDGIHGAVMTALRQNLGDEVVVRSATLDEPEHGLTDAVLDETDVLTWWGHLAHEEVAEPVVERVADRVLRGMGLVVLHSGHMSRIFRRLMGTSCRLRWRDGEDRELVWTVAPGHSIAAGIPVPIVIPRHEMYGEYFDIPVPDELVFVSAFSGGEVFRSGCCFFRGHGRIFYFSPGDQDYPVYHQPEISRVLANGVRWAAPTVRLLRTDYAPEYCAEGWFEAQPNQPSDGITGEAAR